MSELKRKLKNIGTYRYYSKKLKRIVTVKKHDRHYWMKFEEGWKSVDPSEYGFIKQKAAVKLGWLKEEEIDPPFIPRKFDSSAFLLDKAIAKAKKREYDSLGTKPTPGSVADLVALFEKTEDQAKKARSLIESSHGHKFYFNGVDLVIEDELGREIYRSRGKTQWREGARWWLNLKSEVRKRESTQKDYGMLSANRAKIEDAMNEPSDYPTTIEATDYSRLLVDGDKIIIAFENGEKEIFKSSESDKALKNWAVVSSYHYQIANSPSAKKAFEKEFYKIGGERDRYLKKAYRELRSFDDLPSYERGRALTDKLSGFAPTIGIYPRYDAKGKVIYFKVSGTDRFGGNLTDKEKKELANVGIWDEFIETKDLKRIYTSIIGKINLSLTKEERERDVRRIKSVDATMLKMQGEGYSPQTKVLKNAVESYLEDIPISVKRKKKDGSIIFVVDSKTKKGFPTKITDQFKKMDIDVENDRVVIRGFNIRAEIADIVATLKEETRKKGMPSLPKLTRESKEYITDIDRMRSSNRSKILRINLRHLTKNKDLDVRITPKGNINIRGEKGEKLSKEDKKALHKLGIKIKAGKGTIETADVNYYGAVTRQIIGKPIKRSKQKRESRITTSPFDTDFDRVERLVAITNEEDYFTTVRKNVAKKGYEITFESKPNREFMDHFGKRGLGFIWNGKRKVWYIKEENLNREKEKFLKELGYIGGFSKE